MKKSKTGYITLSAIISLGFFLVSLFIFLSIEIDGHTLVDAYGHNPYGDIEPPEGDGDVDIFDYNQLVSDFGKTGSPGFIAADIDSDGVVGIFDYNILLGNFGK